MTDFTEIVDRYGAASESWPASVRAACQQLLSEDALARELLQQQRRLDMLLDAVPVPEFPGLESRIQNQPLPPCSRSLVDTVLEWLFPSNAPGKQFWRPAMAACLPLVVGIVVGNFFSFGISNESPGFDYWDDELYMLSLNDYTENLF